MRGTPLAMLAAQCSKLSSKSPPPLADAAVGKGFHPWKKSGNAGNAGVNGGVVSASMASQGNVTVTPASAANHVGVNGNFNALNHSGHQQRNNGIGGVATANHSIGKYPKVPGKLQFSRRLSLHRHPRLPHFVFRFLRL